MLSLFLIGISPISGPIQSGPPAPHLNRNEHVQQAFHQNLRWKAFQKDWGEEWGIRWDERNGTPRFLYAPGTSIRDESKLVLAISKLVDVPFDDWSFDGSNTRNERRTSVWRRQHQGVSVIGDAITIVSHAGQIHGIWIQVTPLVDIPTPKSNEMVLPIPLHKGPSTVSTGVQSHLVTEHQDNDQIFYLDRLGRDVYRYSTRHYGTIEMSLEERTVDDPLIVVPARGVTVENQEGSTVLETDDEGSHAMTDDPLRIRMAGSTVIMTVDRQALAIDGRPDTLIEGGIDVPMSATSVHHHFNVVWDWLREQRPDHPWLDDQVLATVELSDGTCNAYYTNGTINFLLEDPESCHNLGQIADVTYHEVGHGIHHYILESGTFAGDVSEGSADFISATILDDPVLAPNARPDGSYIRELETDKRYPEDAIGQVHNDGLIWGSFFWNLREQWEEDTPETGVNRTNQLFLNALAYGPTLTDAYEAVILADDDDGDWSNSTPHACELTDLLDHHGLGPGPMGVMIFEHSPVESVGSFDTDYPVNFSLYPLTEACIDSAEVVAKLWYTTDPSADLEQLEAAINDHSEASKQSNQEDHQNDTGVVFDTGISGDTGWSDDTGWTDSDTDPENRSQSSTESPWVQLSLDREEHSWSGRFPRQLPATWLRYLIQIETTDGEVILSTHGGVDSGLYSFRVGDREALWCEGFEGGNLPEGWTAGPGMPRSDSESTPAHLFSEWEFGHPDGSNFNPTAPYAGEFIAATALNRSYSPNNRQYLQSPELNLGDVNNPMRLLSYRRWLTVEDGTYDQAHLRVNEQTMWRNRATEAADQHTLDQHWTLHEIDLLTLDDPSRVQFDWSLSSDGGLEFGGWALDDVCIVQLADLDGHYRVRDLVATDEQEQVHISWTHPWIEPLFATALVRKIGGVPESLADGTVVNLDLSPHYGASIEVMDTTAVPGQQYYYALFTTGAPGQWILQTVEGQNWDMGGIPAPEIAEVPPSLPPIARWEVEGCDCSASSQRTHRSQLWWILVFLGWTSFRRRVHHHGIK